MLTVWAVFLCRTAEELLLRRSHYLRGCLELDPGIPGRINLFSGIHIRHDRAGYHRSAVLFFILPQPDLGLPGART